MRWDISIKDKLTGFNLLKVVILLILTSFMLSVSGYLRLTMGVAVLGALSLFVLLSLLESTNPMERWRKPNKIDEIIGRSMLEDQSERMERAYQGRKLSQALLEEELKENFLSKVKRERDLDEEELENILEEPEELRTIIEDRMIFKFLMNHKTYKGVVRNKKDGSDWKLSRGPSALSRLFGDKLIQEDKKYRERMERLIDRMEEWN